LTQQGHDQEPAHGHDRSKAGQASPAELVGRTSASAPGRALVPTAPVAASNGIGTVGCSRGTFLAQLIATTLKLPQTRTRRRAEPGDASAIYTAAAIGPVDIGLVVRCSL
jgi:hypothetical protein